MAFTPIWGTGFEMGAIPAQTGKITYSGKVTSGGAHTGTYAFGGANELKYTLDVSDQRSDISIGAWSRNFYWWGVSIHGSGFRIYLSDGNIISILPNATQTCLDAYVGNTKVATGSIIFDNTVWFNIQIQVSIGNSGYIKTMVEGTPDIDYSGDTMPGASSTITDISYWYEAWGGSPDNLLDDWVIGYGDWSGDIRFDGIYPDGDTATHDWLPVGISLQDTPAAPTVAVGDGTGLTGTYRYKVTLVDPDGETLASTASASVTPANQDVDLSNIPTGVVGYTTARKIYRTAAGGATYKLCYTMNDNTTTTYTDSLGDGSLGADEPANVHYNKIDEMPPSDADGIWTNDDDASDLHDLSDWAEGAKIVQFCTQWMRAKKDTAGTQKLAPLMNSGGSLSEGTAFDLLTSYQYYHRVMLLNPAGDAWVNADIDGLQIGVKRKAS